MDTILKYVQRLDSSDFIPKSNSDVGNLIADDFFGVQTTTSTFGYTTLGTSGEIGPDNGTVAAGRFTVPSDCTIVDYVSAYLRLEAAGTCPISCAIFTNAGGNTIGTEIGRQTSSVNLSSTSYVQIDVPCNIDLTSYQGQEVWLFVWCDSFSSGNVWHVPYDLNAVSNTIYISWANSYNDWSTVPNTPNEAYDLAYPSIWAQYTVAGGGTSAISGSSAGTSTVGATIRAKGSLVGTSSGVATVTATIRGRKAITGSISGTSTISGTLRGKALVIGSINGTSTVSGTLAARSYLSGNINGTSTISATIRAKGKLTGSISGTTTISATINAKGSLVGSSSGVSTTSATLSGKVNLSGSISSTSNVIGILSGKTLISGQSNGTSTISGTIRAKGSLQGVINGISTTSGTATAKGRLIGSISSLSSASATAKGYGFLAGQINGTCIVTGVLSSGYRRKIIVIS